LNFRLMVPRKLVPVIKTVVPGGPLLGVKFAIVGQPVGTTKLDGLVAEPFGVTTVTGPVVAPVGTVAVIRVGESTVYCAEMPLNRTADAPDRFAPEIATLVPAQPLLGSSDVMLGAAEPDTTKSSALVAVPLGLVTVIRPVVAFAGTIAVICVGELTT
jgi:hypothetical protein